MRRFVAIAAAVTFAAALVGCGASPTSTKAKKPSASRAPLQQQPTQPIADGVAGAVDPRVVQILNGVAGVRAANSAADIVVKIDYHKDSGETVYVRSHVKHQKPHRNYIEVLASSEPKVVGTQIAWTQEGAGAKASVHTKFIGFWVTVSIDLHDDRLRDQRNNTIEATSVDRSLDTLLHPQARVSFKGEAVSNKGTPLVLLDVVSPLSIAPTTREVYAIDTTSMTPAVREMYKGDKLLWKMAVESSKPNPKLTSADFTVD